MYNHMQHSANPPIDTIFFEHLSAKNLLFIRAIVYNFFMLISLLFKVGAWWLEELGGNAIFVCFWLCVQGNSKHFLVQNLINMKLW